MILFGHNEVGSYINVLVYNSSYRWPRNFPDIFKRLFENENMTSEYDLTEIYY